MVYETQDYFVSLRIIQSENKRISAYFYQTKTRIMKPNMVKGTAPPLNYTTPCYRLVFLQRIEVDHML